MKRDLIEAAVSLAEAETNSRPSLAGLNSSARLPITGLNRKLNIRGAVWTQEEDAFLKANLGILSIETIGRTLGRSSAAICNRWKRDLHLTAPRRSPSWLTLEAFSRGLDVDSHSVMHLANRGLILTHPLPGGKPRNDRGPIRVIDRIAALAWIADPMHWLYFKPNRVGTFRKHGQRRMTRPNVVFWREARAAIDKRLRIWDDAWLTPTEAARLIGIRYGINKAINLGILKAVRWGNWWILKSEVLRFAHECISDGWGSRKIKRIHFRPFLKAGPRR